MQNKAADFGVAVWRRKDGKLKQKPFYFKTDIYRDVRDDDTYTAHFDLRFEFPVLLNDFKIVWHPACKAATVWLSAFKTEPFYEDLVSVCSDPSATSSFVRAFILSTCLHNFVPYLKLPPRQIMDYYTLLSMMVDFREFGLMEAVASSRRDTAVIEMAGRLAENGTGKEKKQSIALLATLSPQELKSNMSLIVQARNIQDVFEDRELAQLFQDLDSLTGKFDFAIKSIGSRHIRNGKVREKLFSMLNGSTQATPDKQEKVLEKLRYLQELPQLDSKSEQELITFVRSKRPDVRVRKALAILLGELKWQHRDARELLWVFLEDVEAGVRVRAATSIVMLEGPGGLRPAEVDKIVGMFCNKKFQDPVDRELVARGLGMLKVENRDIWNTLIPLLADNEENVKLEAARAMILLNSK